MREILLIEDSDNDAALLRRAMDKLSIANPLRHFLNGTDALTYINGVIAAGPTVPPQVSVAFIDLILPGMSGFEILERITRQPAFENTLRIVLTNLTAVETIKRAYTSGAQSFLIKPIQPVDLSELIQTYPTHWSFKAVAFGPTAPQSGVLVRAK